MAIQQRVSRLEASLAELKDDFARKAQVIDDELNSVRKLIEPSREEVMAEAVSPPLKPDSMVKESADKVVSQPLPEQEKDAWKALELDDAPGYKKTPVSEPRQPNFLELFVSNIVHSVLGFLLSSLTTFKAPFQQLVLRLLNLYTHYQKQGKAPVFLMTVAGLMTLTFGFAYLLQYSFNSLFNDALKVLTGFAIGVGIVGAGILLSVKKSDFKDYAASIIALGVIFNYLTAYFVGPHYALVSESTGLILLLGVTALSFGLAIVFETRVVAAVTLVGGMFMPLIVGDVESLGLAFLMYLLVLSAANLYLSHRIKWPVLSQLSFILSLSVIEYVGISESIFALASITLLSAFFYLYTYYWTFDGVVLRELLSKNDLAILVANVFYFIYAMLSLSAEPLVLAVVLTVHALVLGLTVNFLRLMQSIMAPMYLLTIGLLIATAVFVLLPADVTSIIWAIEGLAMLYIGFRYTHKLIRAEGYAIFVIAMVSLVWQAIESFLSIVPSAIAWHWINLLAFGVLSFLAYRIIGHFKEVATATEHKAGFIQNEIFSVWGAVALSLVIGLTVPSAMTVLAVIPMLWCFFRVSRHRLRFTQLVGFIFFTGFIVQIVLGMFETQSTVLSEQLLISQLALLELLFFAWALHFYYQHFTLTGKGQTFALKIHQSVIYAPAALILLTLYNVFDRHVVGLVALEPGSIWVDFMAVGVILFLASWLVFKTEKPQGDMTRTRNAYLLSETLSLFISAFFLYSVALVNFEWMFVTAVIPLFYLVDRGLKHDLPYTEKFAWAHFLLFGVSVLLSYLMMGHLHFSEYPWSTKVVLIELLLSGWAMRLIYDRRNYTQGWYVVAARLRLLIYFIVPLLFLPRILRLYPDYIAVALWGSFAISWLMFKKLKIELLFKELSVLFYIAIAATLLISLNAMTGTKELPGLMGLISGLVTVSIFNYVEKPLSFVNIRRSRYPMLHSSSPYFYAFIVAGLSYALFHQMAISVLLTGLFFLLVTYEKRVLVVMRESLSLSYGLTWLALVALPLLVISLPFQQILPLNNAPVAILSNLLAVAGLWFLTHASVPVFRLFTSKYFENKWHYWAFHVVVAITYIGSLNLLFSPWAVAMSIAMLIHAVIILFLTLSEKYKGLLRLSIALYAITGLKVLLYDMNDFGNLHKVFALMGIGCILMAAAFMFQKVRILQLRQP